MYMLFIIVQVIVCILLIGIILIQSGRGGGLTESFQSAESIFGTKTNTFLTRTTSVLAVVFLLNCLVLTFLSLQKSKSLMRTIKPATTSTNATIPNSTEAANPPPVSANQTVK